MTEEASNQLPTLDLTKVQNDLENTNKQYNS